MSATPMLRSLTAPCARPLSPSPSPKKLSARDSPFGLFDPHGRHSHTSNVAVSSTLTIVRMPCAATEPREDGGGRAQTPLPSRSVSFSSVRRSSSPGRRAGRLSFAANSLVRAPQTSTRSSISTSPSHTRSASSPASVLRQAQNQAQAHQRLSAHQIYTSAKQARAPWTRNPNNGAEEEQRNAKSFAPLPADIILPFASRACEVSELFLQGANAKLLALLSHVFPPTSDGSLSISDVGPSSSSSPLLSKLPEDWSFSDLRYWLFEVDRKDVGDALWVRTLRRAILMHSEVLWERVKAVLGAPFDLDAVVRLPSASQTIQGGEQLPLSLNLIHPSPKTVGDALHGIAKHQNVCEDASKDQGDDRDVIVGLRLSTSRTYPSLSLFIPSGAKRSSSPTRAPRLPFRSVSQNTVPTVSSPLAERNDGQCVNDARPAPYQPQSSGTLLGKKAKTHPLFPGSFSNLSSRLCASDST